MKRILIVDDSTLILAQLEDALTAAGYEVVGKATSGQEAIQQAKGLQPDIVLMDVIMPGEIDGIEAAREIIEKFEIPVIFLTGHEEEDLIERIGNVGANGYILKPFRHAELKATIQITSKKKEAEKRLKVLYKDLVENTYDLIYVLDGRGNITFINNTAVKTLGYSFEELIGRNIGDITTPESYRFLEDKFRRQVKAEDVGSFEIHLVDKDKRIRIFEVREQIKRDEDRITELFGIARDVTERRRGEKQRVLLSGLKKYLLGSYRFAEKLQGITDKIVEIFNADFARIWIIKPGDLCDFNCYHAGATEDPHICRYRDRCLHLLASSGRYTHTDGEIHRRVPFDCYKIGKVASGIDPKFITNDVTHDPRVHNHAWAEELGLVSFAGYRLLSAAGDPVGVMALFSKQAVSPEEDELLEDLANTTAQVIQTSRAEEILRESEERYRNLFENSIEPVVITDLRGIITSINRSMSEVSGYSIEELVGRNYRELSSEEEAQEIYEVYNRLYRTGEPIRDIIFHLIHKTGEKRTAVFCIDVLRKGNEIIGFQATIRDITDKHRMEAALKESDQRLKLAVDAAQIGLWDWDIRSDRIFRSEWWFKMLGYSVGEIEPTRTAWATLVHPDDIEGALRAEDEHMRGKTPFYQHEYRILSKTGDYRWILDRGHFVEWDNDGKPVRATGTHIDITERKKAEEALKESEENLREEKEFAEKLFFAPSDTVFVFEPATGKAIRWNDVFRRVTGYSDEEIASMKAPDAYYSEEDLKRAQEAALRIMNEGRGTVELSLITKDGRSIPFEYSGSIVTGKDGSPRFFISIGRDITERKKAEEALKKSEAHSMSLLEAVPDLIFVLNRDGTYVDFKADRDEELAVPRSEIIGKNIKDTGLSREHLEGAFFHIEQAVATKEVQEFEYDLVLPHGPTSWSARMVEIGNGEVFVLARNITERKKAEEAIRISEITYRQIFNTVNDTIWIHDIETWEFLDVNDNVTDMFGYSVREAMDLSIEDISSGAPPYTQEVAMELLKKAAAGEPQRFEWHCRHKDGHLFWGEVNLKRGTIAGKECILAIERDITERKRAEQLTLVRINLLEFSGTHSLEELLQKTLDEVGLLTDSPIGFYHFVEEDQVTLSLQAWSTRTVREFCKAEGKSMHYRIDQAGVWVDCVRERRPVIHNDYSAVPHKKGMPEGHAEVVRELVVPIIRSNRVVSILGIGNKPANYTEQDTNIVSYLADVAWEIAERKIAEEALKESESKFRGVFETSRDFMYITSLDAKIIDYNTSASEFFGYSDEEIRNMTILDLYHDPEDRAKLIDKLKADGFVQNYELRLKKKDGSLINALATIAVRRDTKGDTIGFQGSVRDITQMRRLEQQLIQAEKLSGLGTMISGVAHEINNPLTAIMGNAEFMLIDKEMPKKYVKSLEVMLKESDRAAKIVKGLLTFARDHKQERSMVSINDIIMESYRLREYDLRVSNINAQLALVNDIPKTYADPYQLQQVFTNIISNACDAIRDKKGGELTIRSARKDKMLIVEFQDNGPGITGQDIKRIFDPFFTTKDVGKGTGLGLAMAYGIIRDHDGTIDVESEPGRGAKFIVSIPIVHGRNKREKSSLKTESEQTGKRILVVDDEDSVRDLLSEVLSVKGYRVKVSSSAQEVLTLIEKESFDVILLDIKMPGMGGDELYEHIHDSYPEMMERIVFITGDILNEETQAFLSVFQNRYIEKPFRIEELYRILNELLEQ